MKPQHKTKGERSMRNGTTLNTRQEGMNLYEIDFTPKGTKEQLIIQVWAKNRLDASNYLILNKIWGKQHQITKKLIEWGEKQ